MAFEKQVLDHGYVKFIEAWGHGIDGTNAIKKHDIVGDSTHSYWENDYECGIIEAARQSTQGSFRGWNKDEGLLRYMFNNRHDSPFEFAGMVIEIQAPIFVFREWHRHRSQSYNEMSARYAPLPDLNYTPTEERLFLTQDKNTQAKAIEGAVLDSEAAMRWLDALEVFYIRAEEMYKYGLEIGIPKELARIVLPVGRYSRMRASANLRNWLAFMTLRMHPNAQHEIRQFANTVGEIIKIYFPRTWSLFEERFNGS
jgi:thymidylate synthase (FAD)